MKSFKTPSLLVLVSLPVLAMSFASSAFATTSPEESCAKIERMLVTVQLNASQFSDHDYDVINEGLKEAHLRNCENTSNSILGDAMATITVNPTYADGKAIEADGRFYFPDGREFVDNTSESGVSFLEDAVSNNSAKIIAPFQAAHNRCASGCGFVSWGIWGDARHQAKRSCHNSGEAIDIHAITCGGKTYAALSPRFNDYVSCVRGTLQAIYGSGEHRDHAHIQLPGCEFCAGLNCHGGAGSGDVGGARRSHVTPKAPVRKHRRR